MGLFAKEDKRLREYVKDSVSKANQDSTTLFQWIRFLHQKIQSQEQTISSLHNQLNTNLLTPKDIQELIDNHYALQQVHHINSRVHQINRKVDLLASMHDHHNSRISDMHTRLENIHEKAEKKTSSLKEKLIKKLTRNSKSYVKNTILGFIEKYREVPALQLKEMLVEEQQICSKSSFYRLLQELEDEDRVGVLKEGKQKIYLAKSIETKKGL